MTTTTPRRLRREIVKGPRNTLAPAPKGSVLVHTKAWGTPFAPSVIFGWATDTRQYKLDEYVEWLLHPHTPEVALNDRHRAECNGCALGRVRARAGLPDVALVRANLRPRLAGRDLVCPCHIGQPCHGDVLLEIANAGPVEEAWWPSDLPATRYVPILDRSK